MTAALLPLIPPRMEHLDDNAASEFVSGSLPASAMTKVEGHLAGCRDCRQLVAALAGDVADSNVETSPHEKPSPSQVTQRPTRTLAIGDRVGRYLVLTALGAGGMGVVFSAYDPQLDRKVAIKLLRAGITYNTKEARTRLRREAQAIAQLSHPNVVGVYDVGTTDDGDLYIAMEFVEGDTLTTWLKKYPRTWREIVDVFLQAARGLIAAHSVGLLHRDFKPDNVLVGGDGRVRVTDFGLARSVIAPDDATRPRPEMAALNVELTATGTVLGTPRYMPPEQLTGPDIDARADQFSFCVALYEALYGVHPLKGATSVSMLEDGEKALPPPEGSKVPVAVARIVQRGLDKDRSRRFPTMGALIAELAPRESRSPVRYFALAAIGVTLAAGAVTLATRTPEPIEVRNPDDKGVQPLIDKINELSAERKDLIETVGRLSAQVEKQTQRNVEVVAKLEEVQEKLIEKDAKIQELTVKLVAKAANKPVPQTIRVTGPLAQAHGDLEGCFVEWNEREEGDAEIIVQVRVGADGTARLAQSLTGPDSPMLRLCVQESIERVNYISGPDVLDLEVKVMWSAGFLTLTPRVVAQRAGFPSILDGIR